MSHTALASNCRVLVVAAGKGVRAGGEIPKQYQNIAGKPLLRHTVQALLKSFAANNIHCVIAPGAEPLYTSAVGDLDLARPIIGGATRQESVARGLDELASLEGVNQVMVHDGARPFIGEDLVLSLSDALRGHVMGAIPGLAVTDTIKRVNPEGETCETTVDRSVLRAVQTPQAFNFDALHTAHLAVRGQDLTDDAAVMEAAGHVVQIVPGDPGNMKITNPEDFAVAEARMLKECPDIRVGSGFDVHRFEPGDQITLGGVEIPHSAKLKGHSDADVALHALTDAVLAALSDGDIGSHFPPSDQKWKGAQSHVFLQFAAERVRQRGGILAQVGVILMCEAPKIGPHRDAMRKRIAEICDISIERVSVQATTTERLGFTGREEGIAAQATATIRLPLGDA